MANKERWILKVRHPRSGVILKMDNNFYRFVRPFKAFAKLLKYYCEN